MTKIEEIESRRAQRKALIEEQRQAQLAVDLEALDAAEIQYGDSNVVRLDVPYTPGLPTFALARAAKPAEMKRYQDRVRSKGPDKPGDPVAAALELAPGCLVYPDKETFAAMCEARPLLTVQLGSAAADLATATKAAEGKG